MAAIMRRVMNLASMLSLASQLEQKRLRSGTTPGTSAAIGSLSGSGGRALRATPDARRCVDAVLRVDRELRVDLVLPIGPVAVVAVATALGAVEKQLQRHADRHRHAPAGCGVYPSIRKQARTSALPT